jgi:hypothetical protein
VYSKKERLQKYLLHNHHGTNTNRRASKHAAADISFQNGREHIVGVAVGADFL